MGDSLLFALISEIQLYLDHDRLVDNEGERVGAWDRRVIRVWSATFIAATSDNIEGSFWKNI